MKKVIQIIAASILSGIMLFISSCSDSIGPAEDSVVYDDIIKSSAEQQVLTTKENLRIIVPGGAIEGNMELKITKIGNPPKYEGNSFQVGNNIFNVSVRGSFDLKNGIEFRIKYDKSKLKDGTKPIDFFLGLNYVASQWSKADYTIDLSTEEIVIKYNKPSGSIKSKSQETLQSDDDIIIGDGMVLDKGEMEVFDYKTVECAIHLRKSESNIYESGDLKGNITSWNKDNSFEAILTNKSRPGIKYKLNCQILGNNHGVILKNLKIEVSGKYENKESKYDISETGSIVFKDIEPTSINSTNIRILELSLTNKQITDLIADMNLESLQVTFDDNGEVKGVITKSYDYEKVKEATDGMFYLFLTK